MQHKGTLDITADANISGSLLADGLSYPTSDGSANQVIETDGAGTLSFVAPTSLNGQTGAVTITGVGTTFSTTAGGAITISGSLRVRETDSTPLVDQVTEIVVTTGTLTNLGGGVVQINTGGGGGGSGADVDQLQNTLYGQAFIV